MGAIRGYGLGWAGPPTAMFRSSRCAPWASRFIASRGSLATRREAMIPRTRRSRTSHTPFEPIERPTWPLWKPVIANRSQASRPGRRPRGRRIAARLAPTSKPRAGWRMRSHGDRPAIEVDRHLVANASQRRAGACDLVGDRLGVAVGLGERDVEGALDEHRVGNPTRPKWPSIRALAAGLG